MSIRITLVGGSVRPGNFTSKALKVVAEELSKQPEVEVEVIDPAGLDLPLPGREDRSGAGRALQEKIKSATGIVLATPEYHGSYSSVIKLVIENLGFPSALSGKPVALLGVAAGVIGAIKALEHLRSVCSHVGGIVLPGPASIAGVKGTFDDQGNCTDPDVEKRLRRFGLNLLDYIRRNICPTVALEQMVRERPTGDR